MDSLILIIIVIGIFLYFYFKRKNLVPTKNHAKDKLGYPLLGDFNKVFKDATNTAPQYTFDLVFERSDKKKGKHLVFDTETTGLPVRRFARPEDFNNLPHVVQIAWYLFDDEGKLIEEKEYILKQKTVISADATSIKETLIRLFLFYIESYNNISISIPIFPVVLLEYIENRAFGKNKA